jgi:hypothetical protein
MSLFPTIIIKEILKRNVALTSFMGRITTKLQKCKMGVIECTALALEKTCDDLVGVVGGG